MGYIVDPKKSTTLLKWWSVFTRLRGQEIRQVWVDNNHVIPRDEICIHYRVHKLTDSPSSAQVGNTKPTDRRSDALITTTSLGFKLIGIRYLNQ